jgi:hypothetical protein
LESSNLIVGIDVTKSNEWTGARSFGRKSLHFIGTTPNPYQQAISIIGKTLSVFDEDNLIPCYGFGDGTNPDCFYVAVKFLSRIDFKVGFSLTMQLQLMIRMSSVSIPMIHIVTGLKKFSCVTERLFPSFVSQVRHLLHLSSKGP